MAIYFPNCQKEKSRQQPKDENCRNKKPRVWSQILALVPIYILNICSGMHNGYSAILTPQLRSGCDGFTIDDYEESWIGEALNYFLCNHFMKNEICSVIQILREINFVPIQCGKAIFPHYVK